MINVQIKQEWQAPKDSFGDVKVFPAGLVVEIDDEAGAFLIAAGLGQQVGAVSDELAAGIQVLTDIVGELRRQNISVTFESVYTTLGNMIALQQAEAAAAPTAAEVPIETLVATSEARIAEIAASVSEPPATGLVYDPPKPEPEPDPELVAKAKRRKAG